MSRYLFVDDELISQSQGITLHTNPPKLKGPVLKGEMPWEEGWIHYACVLQEGDLVKMWYGAHPPGRDGELGPHYLCYATSHDGVNWERPKLGLVEFGGDRENNILPVRGDFVFSDPKAPPEGRYKMLVVRSTGDLERDGIYIALSPDGIHWKLHERRLLPFLPDTQNQVLYDPRIDRYVAYLRCWAPLRKVARVEVEDLLEPWEYDRSIEPRKLWGEGRLPPPSYEFPVAISYDEMDPPEADIYTPAVSIYPWARDVYLAFPSVYYHFPEPPEGRYRNDGLLEVQLAVSRDGVRFERPDRRPYIPLGVRGGPEGGSIYMVPGLVRMGDEIYQYYVAYAHSHGEYVGFEELRGVGAVYLAVQRLDGFRSADAEYTGGWLTTEPVVVSGGRLSLNIDCRATGHAEVELRSQDNLPIRGFTLEDCDLVRGNHVSYTVTWRGRSDITGLRGRWVRLHFRMRNAKLYSFGFSD